MNKRTRSKTSLFLIELLIAILFFSIAATVGVRLFTLSHITAEESKRLNLATNMCSTVAEVFEAEDGDIDKMLKILGGEREGKAIAIYYDDNWQIMDKKEDAIYRISVSVFGNNNLATAKIVAYEQSSGKTIYELEDGIYCPQKISIKEDSKK